MRRLILTIVLGLAAGLLCAQPGGSGSGSPPSPVSAVQIYDPFLISCKFTRPCIQSIACALTHRPTGPIAVLVDGNRTNMQYQVSAAPSFPSGDVTVTFSVPVKTPVLIVLSYLGVPK